MEKALNVIHWISYTYYVYLFGYAGLYKVIRVPKMMQGMEALGFNRTWTICIGIGETLGVIGLITGLWIHQVKNASVLFLFPFAVGALIAHFAHRDYKDFYDALIGCILSVVILLTDKYFKINL